METNTYLVVSGHPTGERLNNDQSRLYVQRRLTETFGEPYVLTVSAWKTWQRPGHPAGAHGMDDYVRTPTGKRGPATRTYTVKALDRVVEFITRQVIRGADGKLRLSRKTGWEGAVVRNKAIHEKR